MKAQGTGVYVILHSGSRWHLLFQSFHLLPLKKEKVQAIKDPGCVAV